MALVFVYLSLILKMKYKNKRRTTDYQLVLETSFEGDFQEEHSTVESLFLCAGQALSDSQLENEPTDECNNFYN
tara:strand:+ start:86 stop:307 length:222 start_codon:yes stop_codon:yes gene_type:complete